MYCTSDSHLVNHLGTASATGGIATSAVITKSNAGQFFLMKTDTLTLTVVVRVEGVLCCTLQYIHSQNVVGKIMATEKTTTLTFRIEPNIKDALCTAADRDHRSIANMVAVMIREHCARVGIPIQDKQVSPEPDTVKPKPRKR